jgi:hypothetical protein
MEEKEFPDILHTHNASQAISSPEFRHHAGMGLSLILLSQINSAMPSHIDI